MDYLSVERSRRGFGVLAAAIAAVMVLSACSPSSSTATTSASGGTVAPSPSVTEAPPQPSPIVRELQTLLQQGGYYDGAIDGIYGPQTIAAVSTLQNDLGVEDDGMYGPNTHQALLDALGLADTPLIKELQTELKALGYYTGEVDGIYGAGTINAVKAAQKDCGIKEDGIYGPGTHACLVDLGGDA